MGILFHLIYFRYPYFGRVVRCYLCIPATETASERVFWSAGNIVSKKRQKLIPDHVEELVFLHQNLNKI